MTKLKYVDIRPDIVALSEATLALLRQQAMCQMTDETDSDGDEEEGEHDEILMDAVSDLLPAMGLCMGPAFEPYFRQFFEPLMKFTVGDVIFALISLAPSGRLSWTLNLKTGSVYSLQSCLR